MKTAQIQIKGGEVTVDYNHSYSPGDRDILETDEIEIEAIYISGNASDIFDNYTHTQEIYDDIREKLQDSITEERG